jgi:hypothetical protein
MTTCSCHLINPKNIFLFYKDISSLVPKPKFLIKKNNECSKSSRNYFENLNERFNFNKQKYIENNIFFKKHKNKMQETLHIIKNCSPHDKKLNECNNKLFYKQNDKYDNIGIIIYFKHKIDHNRDYKSNGDSDSDDGNDSDDEDSDDDDYVYINETTNYDDYINIYDNNGNLIT